MHNSLCLKTVGFLFFFLPFTSRNGFYTLQLGYNGAMLRDEGGIYSRIEEGIICGLMFTVPPVLRSSGLEMFLFQNLICSECGDEFTLHSQLAIHMEEHRQELANNRVHTCKACKKEFETSPELKEHMKTHCKVRYGSFLD